MLSGIYTGCACVGVLIILILLRQLPTESNRKDGARFNPRSLMATFIQMKDLRQLLLIPMSVYCGMQMGFFNSDYSQVRDFYLLILFLCFSYGVDFT